MPSYGNRTRCMNHCYQHLPVQSFWVDIIYVNLSQDVPWARNQHIPGAVVHGLQLAISRDF